MRDKNKFLLASFLFLNTLFIAKNVLENDGIIKYILNSLVDVFNTTKKNEIKTNEKLLRVINKIDFNNNKSVDTGITKIQDIFTDHGNDVMFTSTKVIEKHSLNIYKDVKQLLCEASSIPFSFTSPDEAAIYRINKMQHLFIKTHYKDKVTKQAKKIITNTIKENKGFLDTKLIAKELEKNLSGITKQKGYFETVASQVLNHARIYSNMRFFYENEILRYEVSAVMDNATTPICRYMDGTVLSVEKTIERFETYDDCSTIDDVKEVNPWLNVRYELNGGEKHPIISLGNQVLDKNMSGDDLQSLGVNAPPYHGRCRTNVYPVF